MELCDLVPRLLAASVVHSVIVGEAHEDYALISAPTLAHLMEQRSSLNVLSLHDYRNR
jgi:hypothetical protein